MDYSVNQQFYLSGKYNGYNTKNQSNLWRSANPILNQNDILIGENRRNSDVRSLIENLMKTNQIKTSTPTTYTYNNGFRPALIGTQQKIFQQIINLICETNQIREQIMEEKAKTTSVLAEKEIYEGKKKWKGKSGDTFPDPEQHCIDQPKKPQQIEYQSIINKLRSRQQESDPHGNQGRRPQSEIQKIRESNFKSKHYKSRNQLLEILEFQRNKLSALRKQFKQRSKAIEEANESRIIDDEFSGQITKLHRDIERLKNMPRNSNILDQLRYLNDENQSLRQKTISIIDNQSAIPSNQKINQEIFQLEQQIQEEAKNKILFFEDLKRFKQQFQELKQQNRRLKSQRNPSNYHSNYTRPNAANFNNRFMEYQDLVSEMQDVMK